MRQSQLFHAAVLAPLLWIFGVPLVVVAEPALVQQEEVERDYPKSPKQLPTDTAASGVVLVEVDLKGILKLNSLEGAALALQGNDSTLVRARTLRGHVVMFHGLVPGTYALQFIRFENGNARVLLEVPPSTDFTVAVAPGQISYLGIVLVHKKIGFKPPDYHLTYDANREIEAWSAFEKKYADTPWALLAEQRIALLRQGTSGSR